MEFPVSKIIHHILKKYNLHNTVNYHSDTKTVVVPTGTQTVIDELNSRLTPLKWTAITKYKDTDNKYQDLISTVNVVDNQTITANTTLEDNDLFSWEVDDCLTVDIVIDDETGRKQITYDPSNDLSISHSLATQKAGHMNLRIEANHALKNKHVLLVDGEKTLLDFRGNPKPLEVY